MLSDNFVSLHNYTDYSLLQSLISPKDLFAKAKELGHPAVAVTDCGTFASAWDALKASKDTGVKLIIGCDFYFLDNVNKKDEKLRSVVLLAKNYIGYQNILKLNRLGFDNSVIITKRNIPVIDWNLLEKYSEGVICITGSAGGILAQNINIAKFDKVEEDLNKLLTIFKSNLAIEVQPHSLSRNATFYNEKINQIFTNYHCIRLAKKYNIKVVPTCNAFYSKKEDAKTHDILLSIGAMQPAYSNARTKYDVDEFYLKSRKEIEEYFARNNSVEFAKEICDNTVYFSNMCEIPDWIDPKYSNPNGKELPIFPIEAEQDYERFKNWLVLQPDMIKKLDHDKSFLRFRCEKAFNKIVSKDQEKIYLARLDEEFDVLEYHGFSSYMLIVADYINWAQNNGVRVGYGRGSCGGSLVAYLLGIHQADPIKYKLIFARFQNKERTNFPDIDTDFSPTGREKVQDYIKKKYGSDHVAHVSNMNTITPKVFARDIARAVELGGSREDAVRLGNEIADCIPKKIDEKEVKTFKEAVEKSPLFGEYIKRYPELQKYSSICGKYRAVSTHAGGIIISKRPLEGFIPLRKDKDGAIAIEYDKDKAEENGLVKMDTLGLETLDIIDDVMSLIKKSGKELPPHPLPFDTYDEKTYDLISRGDTFCVFQLGTSAGTIDLCKRFKPKSIEDISHINALARPSARDIRDKFIDTKDGKKKVDIMHPSLKRAFGDTYGFGLYEESIMYLAQDVAGWSLHDADRLRKLTKEKGKNPKKAIQWRNDFIEGAKKNNLSQEMAIKIWDNVVEKFSGYGFNISHSILYSMISYHTAYLKAHYPVEFLLANLMSEVRSANAKLSKGNIEKIKKELRALGVKILPPDINKSEMTYTLIDNETLLTGLDALKFVGDDAIIDIIEKRPFDNFTDFMIRCETKKVRSTAIQALVSTGAIDNFGIPRKLIYLYASDFRKKLQVWLKRHNPSIERFEYPWPVEQEWAMSELYALEKKYLGEAIICSKKEAFGNFFSSTHNFPLSELKKLEDKTYIPRVKAEIKNIFEFKVKKAKSKYFGQPMIKATIEDEYNSQCSITIFPDRWSAMAKELRKNKYKFEEGVAIHFAGTVNIYENEHGIILENFFTSAPQPAMPKDLSSKKISIKNDKSKEDLKQDDIFNSEYAIQSLEDDLYQQGYIDLESDDEDSY